MTKVVSFKSLIALLGSVVALVPVPQKASAKELSPRATPRTESKAESVQENVPYGSVNGTELRLYIYEPASRAGATSPAVLLIHGGGWTSLDKSTMNSMAKFLARSGFVAFSADYCLFHDSENRWPAQLDDVQRAVRWIRANAAKYGVNPDRIGAFGHSVGAQLAALLGMEETRDDSDLALARYSSKVQAVVDVSGPSDLISEHDADRDAFLGKFLGGDYAKHPDVWREASPALEVSKQDAPFLIVHGTKDQDVPLAQAPELFEKLQSAGVPASFIKVDDVHTFQTPEARRELTIQTLAFFHRYLVVEQ